VVTLSRFVRPLLTCFIPGKFALSVRPICAIEGTLSAIDLHDNVGFAGQVKLLVLNPTNRVGKGAEPDHYGSRFSPRVSANSFAGYRHWRIRGKTVRASRRGGEVLRALAGQKMRVGMEASGHAQWFERLLAELQLERWVGDSFFCAGGSL